MKLKDQHHVILRALQEAAEKVLDTDERTPSETDIAQGKEYIEVYQKLCKKWRFKPTFFMCFDILYDPKQGRD